jgi:hypothetical protein
MGEIQLKRYNQKQLDACLQLRLSGKNYVEIAEMMGIDEHDVFNMHAKLMKQKKLLWKVNQTTFEITWMQGMPKEKLHFLSFKKPAWFGRKKQTKEDSASAFSSQTTTNLPESSQNQTVVKHEKEQGENKTIEKENQDT